MENNRGSNCTRDNGGKSKQNLQQQTKPENRKKKTWNVFKFEAVDRENVNSRGVSILGAGINEVYNYYLEISGKVQSSHLIPETLLPYITINIESWLRWDQWMLIMEKPEWEGIGVRSGEDCGGRQWDFGCGAEVPEPPFLPYSWELSEYFYFL
ncbi:hypothetical protein O3M35_007549 [Rhynocoris fuscipes]|uniref:Uncharacterized protein n=1 Tax=Rhynocoris fuscipes TaxID=488301 RepID=A0AAW1D9T8_9HEMI